MLHEHLDGCVRAGTLLDLARRQGVSLGAESEREVRAMVNAAGSGSLAAYLDLFRVTLAVLQNEEALERAAHEHVEQAAGEGADVIEIRFAPQLHGVREERAIEAVWRGMERGARESGARIGVIVCGMRESDPRTVERAARAACAMRGAVVGFDLAGLEEGNPAGEHTRAIEMAREGGLGLTLHAGETTGAAEVLEAVRLGATRIGHGIGVMRDVRDGVMGEIAREIAASGVVMEVCVSSNVHTGAVAGAGSHPVLAMHRAGFRVTLQTDNRLMSGTTMAQEEDLVRSLGASEGEIGAMRENGVRAAFA